VVAVAAAAGQQQQASSSRPAAAGQQQQASSSTLIISSGGGAKTDWCLTNHLLGVYFLFQNRNTAVSIYRSLKRWGFTFQMNLVSVNSMARIPGWKHDCSV
jgi:hypothetical protein